MKPLSFLHLLSLLPSTLAWTRTDHWQTSVITTTSKKLYTSSIPVFPTGSPAPKPISSNTSTTVITTKPIVALVSTYLTYLVTVTDLFYAASETKNLCISTGFTRCSPTPTFIQPGTTSITTNFYAPVLIQNPSSCTLTSYSYTTRQSVNVPIMDDSIPAVAQQATQSAQAALVTTWVSTRSTNLGGQAVTTTMVDVYLKEGAVGGIGPLDELSAMSECVDPRSLWCSISTYETPGASCQTEGQVYPPTEASDGGAKITAVYGDPTGVPSPGGGSGGKPDAAAGLGVGVGMTLMGVAVGVVAVML
ncbi:hypothetical protein V8F20_001460 [Naviculisporaceae sp. PSN 640]